VGVSSLPLVVVRMTSLVPYSAMTWKFSVEQSSHITSRGVRTKTVLEEAGLVRLGSCSG
jgi:hypothetical protein